MSDLVKKVQESRRIVIEVGDKKFIARRLTWLEYAKISVGKIADFDALTQLDLVSDWQNIRCSDISPDGNDDLVPFSREIFNAVIEDWPEEYQELSRRIVDETRDFFQQKGDNEKNSEAGTTRASTQKSKG